MLRSCGCQTKTIHVLRYWYQHRLTFDVCNVEVFGWKVGIAFEEFGELVDGVDADNTLLPRIPPHAGWQSKVKIGRDRLYAVDEARDTATTMMSSLSRYHRHQTRAGATPWPTTTHPDWRC